VDNMIYNPFILNWSMTPAAADKKRIASPFETITAAPKENRLKIADEMTVYETSIWIWTLGYNLGWPEAQAYAKNFFDNGISGDMLSALSLTMLKEDLGIQNTDHRMVIKRELDFYFPKTNENQFKVPAGMGLRNEIGGSVIFTNELMGSISSMSFGSTSEDCQSDSVLSTSAGSSADGEKNTTVPRSKCLILTLRPEQRLPVGEKDYLKSIFAKFGYNIEITSCKKLNSYILVFEDEEKAMQARAQSDDLGYTLIKYRERRPKPDKPALFKTLHTVWVRGGKSFRSCKVAMLKKDVIVLVNQQKGRRARVISFQDRESSRWVSLKGWVSLYSETGIQLVDRLDVHTNCSSQGSHYQP